MSDVSFEVGEETLFRIGAHDGLAQPPVILKRGRWALYHTLEVSPRAVPQKESGAELLAGMLWGIIGVCLECEGTKYDPMEFRLRSGITKQSGEAASCGQFYGLLRESDWAELLMEAGDRDWRQPGQVASVLESRTPRTSRGSFLYCAPVAKPTYTYLWTPDVLGGLDSINPLNPVLAFTVINENWHEARKK